MAVDATLYLRDATIKQIEPVERMFRALSYMPRLSFLDALEAFRCTWFGLQVPVKTKDLIEQLDFVCQVEHVGPYAPNYDQGDY